MSDGVAGQAYLVNPRGGRTGPGVLLLHSWWGLTRFFRQLADRLADEGYTVLAPDLLAGARPETPDEAERTLAEADINKGAALVLSSARALRSASADPRARIGVVGYSMGASWGLWLSARSPREVAAAVAYYGTQSIDFADASAAYLGHFAEFDALVSDDEVTELEAHLKLCGLETTFHRYPGTSHWFAEEDRGVAYNADAAAVAWDRTLEFLDRHLRVERCG